MAQATVDLRTLQRQGQITNLAGLVVATWRWIESRLLLQEMGENPEFKRILNDIKSNGVVELIPSPSPRGYGVSTQRTKFQELTPAQLDFALKRQGYFMSESPRPLR